MGFSPLLTMNRYLLTALLFIFGSTLNADCCGGPGPVNAVQIGNLRRDFPLVKQDIDSKRSIPVEEKSKNLSYSGDLRVIWAHLTERINCAKVRGGTISEIQSVTSDCLCDDGINCASNGDFIPFPSDIYGIEFNFYVDYVQDRAWGVAWVQYANAAGLVGSLRTCRIKQACRGSGTCEGVCLRKAYIGYNVLANGCARVDVEVGRRPLWSIFDSRVQFEQNFDGILFSNSLNLGCSDLYLNGGAFIIDQRSYHTGYIGELGYLNILNSGFDFKYSVVDWSKRGPNRCGIKNAIGNQFVVSQFTGYYNLDFDFLWNNAQFYGAFLINTNARRLPVFLNRKENIGWYAGFLMGQVCKEGDWALDVNYQYVEAFAIPECDVSGIGLGNSLDNCFACGDNPGTARGRTNYQGWRFEALYAFTDNLVLDTVLQFAHQIDKRIGGRHTYSNFQLQAIYAF